MWHFIYPTHNPSTPRLCTLYQAQPVRDRDFTQFRVLGRGGFGLVFGCMKNTTGQMYAHPHQSICLHTQTHHSTTHEFAHLTLIYTGRQEDRKTGRHNPAHTCIYIPHHFRVYGTTHPHTHTQVRHENDEQEASQDEKGRRFVLE